MNPTVFATNVPFMQSSLLVNANSLNELRHVVERFDSVVKTITTLIPMNPSDLSDAVTVLTEFAKEAKGEKCGEDDYRMTPAVLFVCRRELFQACFTQEESQCLMKALNECITNTERCGMYTGFFLSLMDYIRSHKIDLENALLGMTVCREIADKLCEEERIRSSVSSDDVTREVLLNRIMSWAEEQNDLKVAEDVRTFYSLIPSTMQNFRRGDLIALYKKDLKNTTITQLDTLNDPGIVYARCMSDHCFNGKQASNTVVVTCDPLEKTAFELPIEKVMNIPFTTKKTLLCSKPSSLIWDQYTAAQSFAENTAETLIIDNLFVLCGKLFSDKSELVEILSPSFSEHAVPAQKARLQCISAKLSEMNNPMTVTNLSFQCEAILNPVLTPFKKAAQENGFRHMIGKAESTNALARLSSVDLLNNTFFKFTSSVAASLKHVEDMRVAVIKGTTKNELSRWYLGIIHEEVDAILAAHGFDPTALPKDYTEVPPSDMEKIKHNRDICNELASGNETIEDLKSMIARVCEMVYKKLDAFVLEMMQVLASDMDIPLDPKATHADAMKFVSTVNEILAKPEMKSNPNYRLWRNLSGDIEYISEMHTREGMKGTSKDIVPISGLIVGRIFRAGKEMEAAIEIWGNRNTGKLKESKSCIAILSADHVASEAASTASPVPQRKGLLNRLSKQK